MEQSPFIVTIGDFFRGKKHRFVSSSDVDRTQHLHEFFIDPTIPDANTLDESAFVVHRRVTRLWRGHWDSSKLSMDRAVLIPPATYDGDPIKAQVTLCRRDGSDLTLAQRSILVGEYNFEMKRNMYLHRLWNDFVPLHMAATNRIIVEI